MTNLEKLIELVEAMDAAHEELADFLTSAFSCSRNGQVKENASIASSQARSIIRTCNAGAKKYQGSKK